MPSPTGFAPTAKAVKSCLPFHDRRPLFLEARSSQWFLIVTVSTGIFTDIFLYAVVVPVFPFSLVERIGVPTADVQHWLSVLLAVYGAALLVGAPICGYLADKVKYRKWPMLAGLIATTAATLLLCLAPTLPLLILGRVLQGLSASVIWVVGLALLADTVESDALAAALGYVGIAYTLGTLFAPLLGGIVYSKSGYYAVFAMTFGVIALDIVLRLTMIEKKAAWEWLNDDGAGQEITEQTKTTNSMHANNADIEPVVAEPQQSDPEKTGVSSEVSSKDKKKTKLPPILSLWTSRRLLAAFWGNLVIASVVTGLDTTLTLFVSRTFGWNSLGAGILFLAPLLPSFFSPLIGRYVDKHGARWVSGLGLLLISPFLALLGLVHDNSINQKVLLAAILVLCGVGIALVLNGLTAEFGKVCDAQEQSDPGVFGKGGAYAQSYGIFNISWAAGSLIGAFWAGGIYNQAGWGTVTWTWALLCGVSALPVILFTDGWIGKTRVGQRWTSKRNKKVEQQARL